MNLKSIKLLATLFVLAFSIRANASVILDQSNNPASTFGAFLEDVSSVYGDNAYQTQTFTVGVDGILDHVDVLLGAADPTAGSFTFELFATTATGAPDYFSAPLATVNASYDLTSSSYAFSTLDFSSDNIAVSVGDTLAVVGVTGSGVATTGLPIANWIGADGDPYSGGAYYAAYIGDPGTLLANGTEGYDLNFRTYVDTSVVPIPAAAWLFGSGLLGLVGVARRKS